MPPPLPELPGVEHRFVDAAGLRMHVAESGQGPPVVLLAGWPQHWWMWRKVIPRLARHYRVLCPDLRGFGWTDAPRDGYEKETLARDVVALLDALGLERVFLAGHDWGGIVGFLVSLRAPERVERFVPLNCGHVWPRMEPRRLGDTLRLAYQLPLSVPILGRELHVRGAITRVFGRAAPWTPDEQEIYLAPARDPAHAAAASAIYRTFLLHDLPAWLRGRYRGVRLRIPTLMLHGLRDPVVRPHMLEGWEANADEARTELVPGVAHFIVDEAPELVAGRLLDFFEGARPERAAPRGDQES